MTTAALSRARTRVPARGVATGALVCAWAVAAVAVSVVDGADDGLRAALVYGAPVAAGLARLVSRSPSRELTVALAAVCLLAAALAGARIVERQPLIVFALPVVLCSALIVRRRPVGTVVLLFFLASSYGSLKSLLGVSAGQLGDLAIAGLWLSLAAAMMFGRREVAVRLTPGVALLGLYLVLTLVAVPFSEDATFALANFRHGVWHLAVLFPVAYWAWRPGTLERATQLFTVVALLGGAYATLRWAIGPAEKERSILYNAQMVQYNQILPGEDKVMGAFPSGQDLGFWASLMIPFCFAVVLSWRGPYRIVALAAIPLCVIGLLGSGQRAGVVAVAAGGAVVLAINQMARGFRGPRLGVAAAALVGLVVAVAVIFPAVVDSPEKRQRYTNILHTQQDASFQERLFKWRNAFADIRDHPFGRGIGQGMSRSNQQQFQGNAADNVDNAYVAIAYDQGTAVMVLFIVALALMLFELTRHAIWTRAPGDTAACMAAAGILTAMAVSWVANIFIESFAATTAWLLVGMGAARYVTLRPPAEPAP